MKKILLTSVAAAGLLLSNVPVGLAATATTAVDATADTTMETDFNNRVTERRFIRTFMRVGANMVNAYSNDSLATSSFDFREYVNHPCYVISGEMERKECRMQFGNLAELKKILANGELFRLLSENELAFDAVELNKFVMNIRNAPVVVTAPRVVTDRASDISANEVWSMCIRTTDNRANLRHCFQRNSRHRRD